MVILIMNRSLIQNAQKIPWRLFAHVPGIRIKRFTVYSLKYRPIE